MYPLPAEPYYTYFLYITNSYMAPKGDNVVVSNMKLENLLSMKGGKGAASYANNSQAQVIIIYSILFYSHSSHHMYLYILWFLFPCFLIFVWF